MEGPPGPASLGGRSGRAGRRSTTGKGGLGERSTPRLSERRQQRPIGRETLGGKDTARSISLRLHLELDLLLVACRARRVTTMAARFRDLRRRLRLDKASPENSQERLRGRSRRGPACVRAQRRGCAWLTEKHTSEYRSSRAVCSRSFVPRDPERPGTLLKEFRFPGVCRLSVAVNRGWCHRHPGGGRPGLVGTSRRPSSSLASKGVGGQLLPPWHASGTACPETHGGIFRGRGQGLVPGGGESVRPRREKRIQGTEHHRIRLDLRGARITKPSVLTGRGARSLPTYHPPVFRKEVGGVLVDLLR